ncbi:MAG: phosphoribosylformylglycinamidine synthase subunit PurQ, partial [Oscillospiraceae bacterium]|nr:phosphoribosylformylglycinamidine synthase subunit PurQ [Oscillospiraceae bacterium]
LDSVSLSANWMWPCRSQKGEDARLYAAVKALSDFCCEIGVNVPTGKDSLSMSQQYPDGTKIIAPGTVIVSSGGEVNNVRGVVSPVIVNEKDTMLFHIDFSYDQHRLGGSALAQSLGYVGSDVPTVKNPTYFADAFDAVQELVQKGLLLAGHDISAGGLITTLLEMTFANKQGGLFVNIEGITDGDYVKSLFAENPGVVVQIRQADKQRFFEIMDEYEVQYAYIGCPDLTNYIESDDEYKAYIDKKKPLPRALRIAKGEEEILTLDICEMRSVWYETSHLLDRKQSFHGQADERAKNYANQPLEFQFNDDFTGKLKLFCLDPASRNEGAPVAAIIREKGTNGEREMAYALYLAGFRVKDVMMTDLISGRETLEEVQMIVFCGGFSNSDVLGSAKGWAGAFLYNPKAKEALEGFYARKDTLSLGICNGCQL